MGGNSFFGQHEIITLLFQVKQYNFGTIIPIRPFRIKLVNNFYTTSDLIGLIDAKILLIFTNTLIVARDNPIWSNKLFLNNKSYLTQNDELIVKFKRWYIKLYE